MVSKRMSDSERKESLRVPRQEANVCMHESTNFKEERLNNAGMKMEVLLKGSQN